ncbi:MAG: DUF3857 domain-containing protein [Lentimicrobiaceae bacterium]|jgi:hypothetical protein|nr:DUF3857 domain-containing protein [Lentimicrobiaceae bacterium]
MKHIILYSIFALFTTSLFGQTVPKGSDARFEEIRKEYVVNDDGSVDFTHYKRLKLISNRSFFSSFGETFIIYNPEFQQLIINESYTIRPGGSRIETPENAFNPGLPFSCTDCERYNGMREMIITHTALEYNAIIVLSYTIRTKPEFVKEFMETIELVESAPISSYTVSINIPKSKKINYLLLNSDNKPKISETKGTTYTWEFENLKQSTIESYLPNNASLYPILLLSTYKDLAHAYFTLVDQEAFKTYALPQSKKLLSEITNDTLSALNNALAIRNFVVDNIRLNTINFKYNNFVVAPATKTWQSNCGNAIEKTVLLTALLNEAGFQASPVAFADAKLHNEKIACLNNLETFGVRVVINGQDFILSAVSKNPTSLERTFGKGFYYILDATVDSFKAQTINPIENTIHIEGNIAFDKDAKAKGILNCNIHSKDTPCFDLIENQTKAASLIQHLKGKVENIKVNENGLQFVYQVENITRDAMGEAYYAFTIPEAKSAFKIKPENLPTTRIEPLKCGTTNEKYTYSVNLPEGAKRISKDFEINMKEAFGELHIQITLYRNGSIRIDRELKILKDEIAPADYKAFRKMMILWNDPITKSIIYKQ